MPDHYRLQGIPERIPDMLEHHRRMTLQVMFVIGALVVGTFLIMNMLSQRYFLVAVEAVLLMMFVLSVFFVRRTRHLNAWTITFLLLVYSLTLLAMVVTEPEERAFVWLFLMPVLAYILLGKTIGMRLSLPFVILALGYFTFNLWQTHSPLGTLQILILANVYPTAFLIVYFIHVAESNRSVALQELVRLASTDPLTGLLNRGRFQDVLQQCVEAASRHEPGVALIILDLDFFKQINDRLGHDAGDRILVELAQRLRSGVRATDYVARLGGEEFGILVTDLSLENSGKLAEELRQLVVATPFNYQGQDIAVAATLGVAHCPEDATTAMSLYKMADRRLYWGKEAGRNQVVITHEKELPAPELALPGGSAQ